MMMNSLIKMAAFDVLKLPNYSLDVLRQVKTKESFLHFYWMTKSILSNALLYPIFNFCISNLNLPNNW